MKRASVAIAGLALMSAAIWAPTAAPVRATLWSATLLASFVGWGSLVNRWLAPRRRADWGLRAGWGMAFFILTGGFLCLLRLAFRPVLVAHVASGVFLLAANWARGPQSRWSVTRLRRHGVVLTGRVGTVVLLAGAYALVALTFFAFLGDHAFQPSDDPPFYFLLAEKLMQTGSLFEPYAARRASLFCGEVYLNASFVSVASIYYLHVVDGGIAFVVVAAILVGYVRSTNPIAAQAVPLCLTLLLLFTLQDVRVNTNCETSAVAMILTLYRTVRVPFERGRERPVWPMEPRRIIALGALTIVPTLLRTSNAPAMLMFTGLVFLFDFLLGTRLPWTRASWTALLRAAALAMGAFAVSLLPWAILQKQSTGTYVFPFGHPNVTPGWTFLLKPTDLLQEGTELVQHLFYGKPVVFFLPFVVAGLIPLRGRARNDVTALALGSLVGFAVLSHQSVAFGPNNTARYYFSFVAAAALVAAASVGRDGPRAAVLAAVLGLHLAAARDDTRQMFDAYVKNAWAAHFSGDEREYTARTADYVDVQSHVPAGATMAIATFESFRFDFRRNTIYSLDIIGGMGPKPGWPVHQGPQALSDYLVANGVQYLVVVDFGLPSEFYNRDHWKSHLSKVGSYLQGEAVIQLDAEDAIDKLLTMRHVIYKASGMSVIDLRASS